MEGEAQWESHPDRAGIEPVTWWGLLGDHTNRQNVEERRINSPEDEIGSHINERTNHRVPTTLHADLVRPNDPRP